jgi:hypothetical protein
MKHITKVIALTVAMAVASAGYAPPAEARLGAPKSEFGHKKENTGKRKMRSNTGKHKMGGNTGKHGGIKAVKEGKPKMRSNTGKRKMGGNTGKH